MILRKPYAFFIKHFRFIHIILAILVYYSIYCSNRLLSFFNEYSTSLIDVIGQDLSSTLITPFFKLVPILIIVILIIILVVMFIKKKPMIFYAINVVVYIYLFVIVQVADSTLSSMSVSIVNTRFILLVRDLIMASFIIQTISGIFLTIRATGFDVRKFNFKEDLKELDINEEDREEFEVEFKLNKNEIVRTFRRTKRFAKYIYKENKFLSNLCISGVLVVVCVIITIIFINREKVIEQNVFFNESNFNINVTDSYLVNTDYRGNVITNDYYLLLRLKIKNNSSKKTSIDIATTKLLIDNYVYTPVEENVSKLFDFGTIYRGEEIGAEYENIVLVYRIPKQLINKKILFSFVDKNSFENGAYSSTKVNIKYKNLIGISSNQITNITNEVQFLDSILPDYKVNINAFDIQKQYKLSYNFCISNECVTSYEYLKANLNTNYDKALLKIKGTLQKETNISGINDLYDFIEKFGRIRYIINGKVKNCLISGEVISKKLKENDTYYIEVDEEIIKADKISLVFTIRNRNYEYVLK